MSVTSENCVTLGMTGMHPADIAEKVGCARATVSHYLMQARKDGIDVPRHPTGPMGRRLTAEVSVPRLLHDRLERLARARGMTANALARRLLANCVAGDLVDAVLDDEAQVALLDGEMAQ